MLAKAQEAGQILDEEQLAFLADPMVSDGQAIQSIIPNNAAFQTEDLNTYDFNCDDISNAKAVLMAKISNNGFGVISRVPYFETYLYDMENQSLAVLVFFLRDDLIACLNKAMAFLTDVASSRETMASYSGTGYKSNATSFGGNNASGQARVAKCYNYQGLAVLVFFLRDDLIACLNKAMDFLTDVASSRETKASYSGTGYKSNATSFGGNNASRQARVAKCYNYQDEEQLAFLADPRVSDGQAIQSTIPNNAAFQTEDLDTYDSDCDDISNAKAVLMAKISNNGSGVISR
nr:hypothetical protein [Tanacetum cinerariifolium]